MATNRKKRSRFARRDELSSGWRNYLLFGRFPAEDDPEYMSVFLSAVDYGKISKLWVKHREYLLKEWQKERTTGAIPYAQEIYERETRENEMIHKMKKNSRK
ncbi:MAG: hypothetical protein AVO38_08315 [delta proteobacterium ML8_D]|nr:MAG: hypothetical protein AVO38_08315 [delta proteobacterium ML8_D]